MKFATLTCKRDMSVALHCLGTLRRYCMGIESLTVFEDGSFSDEDAQVFQEALPGVYLRRRAECDQRMAEVLQHLPECQRFRVENPLALKLFDIPLLSDPGTLYVDSDVMFFRPFCCDEIVAIQADHFVFMADVQQGYSGRIPELLVKHRLHLSSKINTGIWSAPPGRHDLKFIEWFLGVPEFRIFPNLVEQTCWAAMAGREKVLMVDPRQVYCVSGAVKARTGVVGIHFIGDQRKKMANFFAESLASHGAEPIPLHVVEAAPLTLGRMVLNTIENRWRSLSE